MRRAAPAIEALIALAVTLPLAVALRYPTLWFLVPFAIVTVTKRPYDVYGLTLRNPGSLRFHLRTAGVIFGGYALLHYAFARVVLGLRFVPALPLAWCVTVWLWLPPKRSASAARSTIRDSLTTQSPIA